MKKNLYIMLSAVILLFCNLIYNYASADEDKRSDITGREIIKEMNLLKNSLSSMDIYTEPCREGSLQITGDYKDGKEVIVKTLFNLKGDIISIDKYSYIQDKLLWEHKELFKTGIHFIITVEKNGTLKKEEFSVNPAPAFTHIPTISSTPAATPKAFPVKPAPSSTPDLKFKERIIFTSDFNGNMDIYTMNLDGTNLHQITKEKCSKSFPSLSPDGLKIIYSANEDGNWSIYTINLDGTMEKRITNSGSSDIIPSFIDNNNIIFQSFREGLPQIYKMTLDTKKVEPITENNMISMHPALYPDKKTLVFAGEKEGAIELYSIDTDGKNLKQLTHSGFEKFFPSVSPDGERIAFSGNSNGNWYIYTVDPSRGIQKKIETGFNDSNYPSWSQDGKYIVFQALDRGKTGLFKINISGQEDIIKLTDNSCDSIQARCQFIMAP